MIKVRKNIIFILLLISFYITNGQGFKRYDIETGLPSNRIYKVIQDNKGFIWVATDKGLSKFDGAEFINFTTAQGLPSNDIWEIYLDQKDRLWYFTRANSFGYIKNDSVYNFKGKNEKMVFYPISINRTKDSIHFLSFGQNYHLKNKNWVKIPRPNKFINILIHPHIKGIDFTLRDSIYLFDQKFKLIKKIKYNKNPIKKNAQINDSLFAFITTKDFYILNLNSTKLYKIPKIKSVDYKKFIRIYADSSSIQISGYNFWAELSDKYKLKNFKNFNTSYNLSNIYKDYKNNFWLSSYNKGLYFSSQNSLTTKYFFINKKIKFLKKSPSQKLLVGILDEGIYEYNPSKSRFDLVFPMDKFFYNIYYLDKNNFVLFGDDYTLIKRKGKVEHYSYSGRKGIFFNNYYYTTSLEGLNKFTPDLEFSSTIPIKDPTIFIEYQNKLIIGGVDGLYQLTQENKISKITFRNHLLNSPVLSLAIYKNNLLIGTDGKGLYIWDGKNSIIPLKKTNKLIVKDIETKNDKVWIATQKGVLVYKEVNDQLRFLQTIRKNDGLVSDQVDDLEFLNNKLVSASLNGISFVDINHPPNLPLQNIYFKNITYGPKKLKSVENKVKYNKQNNLIVKFGAIDFSGQEHNHFFYRLLPNQKNWVETKSKIIEFNNLQPGKFLLKIKGENPYGQVLKKQFQFEITPLWWQTNLAKTAMGGLILLSFGMASYWVRKKELAKQRKKLLQQKEKVEFELYALRSQMNPHFVFNSLNAIQYYINDENYDKSEAYLVKFSRLIRMIFDFSRFKSVALRQEIKLLKSYLEIEKMRFGEDFNFCINIDSELNLDQTEIPTMLLQPIVENAVNHGIFHKQGKGTICLDFKKIDENTFQVRISDDGIGIEKSKEINKKSLKRHTSRSTEILKKRIELLNLSGKWKISYELQDLSHNKGKYNTVVTLKITKL